MKKNLLILGMLLMACFTFTSCSDDDDNNELRPTIKTDYYAYIVNAGNWNENNGDITGVKANTTGDAKTAWTVTNIYNTANGYGIGDAQDAAIIGDKIFVTSTTSSKVEVLDANGKVEKSIKLPNASPRYIAYDNDFAYVSAYDGTVYRFDAKTFEARGTVEVGAYAEGLSVSNGKLYVNISNYMMDGTGKKVAVVDLKTFTKTKDIEVELNPYSQSIAVGNKVFIVSNLDYTDNILQEINTTTDTKKNIGKATTIAYDRTSNSLVCVYAVYGKPEKRLFRYDIATGKETDLNDLSDMSSPSRVCVDPTTKAIVIVEDSYMTPCKLFIYNFLGKLEDNSISAGYGTQNVIFTR